MILGRYCYPNIDKMPESIDMSKFDNIIGGFGLDDAQEYYAEIVGAKELYKYTIVSFFFCTIVFMLLVRYFAQPLVWLVIFGVGAALGFITLFMKTYHEENFLDKEPHPYKLGKILKYSTYFMYILIALYFIAMICFWKTIAACTEVLKVASAVMLRNTRIMLVPLATLAV